MLSKVTLKIYKLMSLVATKCLESYLIALKRRKSYLEGEIQHIESEIEDLDWNVISINNFKPIRNRKDENK
ncbi:MAG: hypothetical protein DRI61_15940 [Chloroflexi bacterium]|nr:MAG: hypothetical protein DRI61_15940 [Chloroflexota bacterium]